MTELIFEEFHARNLEVASQLRELEVVIVGAGAVGSNVATLLALMGVNVVTCDPDPLSTPNLARTRADRDYLNVPKGLAVAATIRGQAPEAQRITGLALDVLQLPRTEVWNLLRSADAVVAATGNPGADRLLNWVCLHRRVPLIVPSMWPSGQEILADLLVVPADQPEGRVGCFECLRPPRPAGAPLLEAQEGVAAEVGLAASVTAMTIAGLLLPDSEEHRDLDRLLDLGAGYRVMRRQPFAVVPVRNPQRRGCRACAAARQLVAQGRTSPTTRDAFQRPWHSRLRDWLEGFII